MGDHSGEGKLLGNILILISAVIWASSTVYARPLVAKYSPYRVLTLSMPGALIVLVPYGLMASLATPWAQMTPLSWGMLAYVAVAAGAVGFVCFYEGVRQIGGPAAMLYQYLVPVLAAASAWLVLGKTLSPMQLGGVGVVLSGVALSNYARYGRPGSPVPAKVE